MSDGHEGQTMIICKDCGHQNEHDDQFCGSCGSFLEWTGAKVEASTPVAVEVAHDANDPTVIERVRKAVGLDTESIDEHRRVTREQLSAEVAADQGLADSVSAERAAAAEAERRSVVEIEAARSAEAAQRVRAEKEAAAEKAQQHADQLRDEAAAAEKERETAAQQERARRAREAVQAAAAAEAAERDRVEQERARREAAAIAAQQQAEREAGEADRAAMEARAKQEQVTRDRSEADRRLSEAAAAAAAAHLRAAQENDAIAAAQAASSAALAESNRVQAEALRSTAAAMEEAAAARTEAAEARAEAARLRSDAQGRASVDEVARARADAARDVEQAAATARKRAEADAESARLRADAETAAQTVRAKAEHDARAKQAEADAARMRAEAATAKARAEAEQVRQQAEADAAKRAREEALRRASALVAKPVVAPVGAGGSGAGEATMVGAGKPVAAAVKPATVAAPQAATTATTTGLPGRQPGAQLPGKEKERPSPKRSSNAEMNPGDLVCGQCGTGNPPSRKFCRRCGNAMAEAAVVKLGFWARLRWRFRRTPKAYEAGARRRSASGAPAAGVGMATKGRIAWYRLNSNLTRIGAVLAMFAVLGFGVEPIRQKLQLPNVRQAIINKFRQVAKPVYDEVSPASASATSSAPTHSADLLIDRGNNTYWAAAPSPTGGVGSAVTIRFAKPFDLARIVLTSGAQGDTTPRSGFVSQPRPSELRFIVDGDVAHPTTVAVKDSADPQTLTVKHKAATTVVVAVTGVYPAAQGKGKSVAITEMEFFQRRKLGDDYETLPAGRVAVTSAQPGAKYLTDDNLDSAWTSEPANDGVGQGFTVTFATPIDIDRIRIAPGHAKADFTISPRPKDLQLVLTCRGGCEPTKQVTIPDKAGFNNIAVAARGVTAVQVQVRSVNGTGGGVAFAEIQFQRKRPKGN